MHLQGERDIAREATAQRAAFIAFDMLRDGSEDLRPLPLTDRRARLERLFGASGSSEVRHGELRRRRRPPPLQAGAASEGWEGLIAKRADSRYESGRRSPAWRKLKLKKSRVLVVGGWTEPRETRQHFGALRARRLRARGPGREAALRRARRHRLHRQGADARRQAAALVRDRHARRSTARYRPTRPSHWVQPELVAEVTFTGWTDEPHLRHPVYLGLRDDVEPRVRSPLASARVPGVEVAPRRAWKRSASVQMWRGMPKAKAGAQAARSSAAASEARRPPARSAIPTTPELDAL